MTRGEFISAVQVMCDGLPCHGQERRVNALYEFHSETEEEVVKKAARQCAHEMDRFPTPKVFSEVINIYRKKALPAIELPDFKDSKLSDNEIVRLITTRQIAGEGKKFSDPVRFALGWRITGPILKRKRPGLYERVERLLPEIVGPARLKEILARPVGGMFAEVPMEGALRASDKKRKEARKYSNE